jgi:hypothetical protein
LLLEIVKRLRMIDFGRDRMGLFKLQRGGALQPVEHHRQWRLAVGICRHGGGKHNTGDVES